MSVDIEKLKQLSAERLYEDEGFLSELRQKYGDKEGEKKFRELEMIIIDKVNDFIHLDNEDKIMKEMYSFIKDLKVKTI